MTGKGRITSLYTVRARDARRVTGRAEGHGDAGCCMLNILGDTLSEVEIDMLVDTLVERQARMQIKSLKE